MFKSVKNQNLQPSLSCFALKLKNLFLNEKIFFLNFSVAVKQSASDRKVLTSANNASVKTVSHLNLDGKQNHFCQGVNVIRE